MAVACIDQRVMVTANVCGQRPRFLEHPDTRPVLFRITPLFSFLKLAILFYLMQIKAISGECTRFFEL